MPDDDIRRDDPLVVRVMREYRNELLDRDRGQMRVMTRRWMQVEESLQALMDALANDIAQKQANNESVSLARVMRMERYQRLMAQMRDEVNQYARWLENQVTDTQRNYMQLGFEATRDSINAVYRMNDITASFDFLPVEAVRNMVGLAGNGSPLYDLLKEAYPTTADAVTRALLRATALGQNPRVVAREMTRGMGAGLARSLTISRTEQLRVYREAQRQSMIESGVVTGYKRIATRDFRVCPACLFDDGRVYKLEIDLAEHPRGRCGMIPIVKDMPEIAWLYGQDWFGKLTESEQRQILGGSKYEAWQSRGFDLSKFVKRTFDKTWGSGLRVATMGELAR